MEQELADVPLWAAYLSFAINGLVYARTALPNVTGSGPVSGILRVLQTIHDVLAGNFGKAKNER